MVDSDGGLIYGLEYQCRSLCAVEAETDKVQFLVGTQVGFPVRVQGVPSAPMDSVYIS